MSVSTKIYLSGSTASSSEDVPVNSTMQADDDDDDDDDNNNNNNNNNSDDGEYFQQQANDDNAADEDDDDDHDDYDDEDIREFTSVTRLGYLKDKLSRDYLLTASACRGDHDDLSLLDGSAFDTLRLDAYEAKYPQPLDNSELNQIYSELNDVHNKLLVRCNLLCTSLSSLRVFTKQRERERERERGKIK